MSDTVISSVLICPKCKYTNPNQSRFCMQCGSAISNSEKQDRTGKLVLIEKGKPGQSYPFSKKAVVGKDGDVNVSGADFAKKICELSIDEDKASMKILSEGVYIKAEVDSIIQVESGTEIRIGEKIFRVEY